MRGSQKYRIKEAKQKQMKETEKNNRDVLMSTN